MTDLLAEHEAEVALCVRLYVEERLSCPEIGRRLGMGPVTVRKRLDEAGIPRPKGRCRRTAPETIAAIRALTAEGLSQREIGRQLGICCITVHRWQSRLRPAGGE
jgi:transposase